MAALLGGFSDCTAFVNNLDIKFWKFLKNNGYIVREQILYNGMTGEQLETVFWTNFYLD